MAKVFLDAGDTYTAANNDTEIYGQTGDETVTIAAGVTGVILDQAVDNVTLDGNIGDYEFQQQGINLLVYSGGVLVATIPVQADENGTQLTFDDGTYASEFGDGAVINIGGTDVPSDEPGPVVPPGTAPTLTIDDVTVAEGDAGTVTATFTVTLSEAPGTGETVTVDYATADATATAGTDYVAATGTLTFAEGETTKTIEVTVNGDTDIEEDETFNVALSNVTGTIGGEAPVITDATGVGTITNDDLAVASYTLTAGGASVTEGENIVFTVAALDAEGNAAAVTEDTTFNYQISGVEVAGGTATPADDFGQVTGTVTIAAGQTTGTFTLTPTDDGVTEGFEGFNVSLLDASFNTVATSGNVVIMDGAEAGKTYTLTSSADTGSSFTGTSGNDTYVGQINADMGTGTTFNAGDSLDGKAGTDTLNVTVAGASTAAVTSTATTLNNIEKVMVSNFDSNADDTEDHEFNASLWTGVTTVGLSSSSATGDTSFTNLMTIADAEMANGAADLTVNYAAAAVAGTADTQNLNLNGVTAGTFIADAGIETVAIMASSTATKSTLTGLTSAGASKLTIDADAAVTITGALGATIKTVDASASSAGVSVDISAAADVTLTGGSGDDVVDIGTELTTSDSLTGGDGTDTLVVDDSSDLVTGLMVSGFETLRLTEAGGSADLSFLSGITTIDYRTGAGNSTTATNVTEGTGVIVSDDANTITHTVKNATNTGVTNELTVTLDHNTAETDIDVATAFVAAGVETINVVSSGITSPTTAAAGSENSIATFAGSTGLATINVTGASDFELTTTGAISTVTSIDGSGMTGRFTVTNGSTATGTVTTKGGTNADTLTGRSGVDSILGGAGNDTIDGADGNDTIDGGDGADSITGGTGNDVITGGAGNDTVDSETGNDNVDLGDGDDVFNMTAAAVGTALTSSDTVAGGLGTDTLQFTHNSNVDLVTNNTVLSNVTGFEKIALNSAAGAQTLTINDLALSINDGNSLTVVANSNQAHVVNASGVLNSSNTVNLATGTAVNAATTTITYHVGNAKDNVVFGGTSDGQVNVGTAAFLSANDTITGGSGTGDQITYTDDNATTIDTTATSYGLMNVTSIETIHLDRTDGTATADYVIKLGDTFVGANYDAVNGKFTVSSHANDTGDTDIDGSAVTLYNLSLTGGTAADTIIGGSGADTISGGAGADTLTGGAGADVITGGAGADSITGGAGADRIVYTAGTEGSDTIVGFTQRGSGTTAPTDMDVIRFTADDLAASGDSILFDTNGTDDGGEVVLADTDPTDTAGTIVTLASTDYAEFAGAASGGTGLQDNHVNVITGRGYTDLNAALAANGVIDNNGGGGDALIDASFVVVFYNTSTQVTEMHHVTDADSAADAGGAITATATQLAGFSDINLAGVADFGYENFEVISLG